MSSLEGFSQPFTTIFSLFFESSKTNEKIHKQITKEKGEKGYLMVLHDPTHHVPASDQWLGREYIQCIIYLNGTSYMPT